MYGLVLEGGQGFQIPSAYVLHPRKLFIVIIITIFIIIKGKDMSLKG